ncbi:hypothetical protein MKX47_12225 [Solibacillus sp. FSL R7-0668]|uniref:phage tail protein n=1 Tax=Solibacillus sp. FSL R7-0668 TaxID=2921688 RepID=UPI0030FB733A
MITVKRGGTEYPVNHIKSARREFAVNDIPELSMIVINRENNPAYPFLNEEEIIVTGDGHEWRIKAESEMSHYKNLNAQHILLDLEGVPFNELLSGNYTPRALLTTIIDGSGFILDLDETGLDSVLLKEFGRKNRWKCLKDAAELLKVEFRVLPGRIIQLRKRLSGDKGKQYRYAYNLKNVTKKSDSIDVVTHVIVNYGEDHGQTATFVSPTASNYARAYYGDIINDERIEDYETARLRAEREFKDIDLSYELDIAQIGNDCELGETIHTIYEPLDDLSITTRILKMKDEWNGEEFILTDATVGNYVFKTSDEMLQDQIKDTENNAKDKIDETKEVINKNMTFKFHETEEKILDQYTTVTTEYNAAISLSARELRTDMSQKVETINTSITAQYNKITAEYNSSISQTAQQIRSEVNASVTSIGKDMQNIRNDVSSVTQTASLIESRVSSHDMTISSQGTRISSAESSITQQANQIQQRVSFTDYTGSRITSLINQDPYAVSISADKINLNGAVIVNGDISGVTNINVQRDITIGNNIYLNPNGGGSKAVIFDGIARLVSDGYNMTLSAPNVKIDTNATIGGSGSTVNIGGNVNFQYANSIQGVARANSSGIGISTSGGILYVQVNGTTIGQVKLT